MRVQAKLQIQLEGAPLVEATYDYPAETLAGLMDSLKGIGDALQGYGRKLKSDGEAEELARSLYARYPATPGARKP
jgi:hypothetical protein